ncbi:MAG: 1-deoxy-D-xylulose-5-phosphate reductoisomerase [Alphaproteobacteria bacterium]|nr:1-deoxy-D-xylulose-5-phosphate reductoisomerase [Alphaproteobacteria bacterium]
MTPSVKTLSVLGATGSIGRNTLDIVDHHRDAFEIVALTAQSNVAELARQALKYRARMAVIGDEALYSELKSLLSGTNTVVAAGEDALVAAASETVDCVMAAIVGSAGLKPTFAAAKHAKRVALANKECLVCAGEAFMTLIASGTCELLPVDSEHSGVFQTIAAADESSIEQITLTASGGPFRSWSNEQMAAATVDQALNHPNWSMGAKVTIDSATMMNKGLELIEAFHLFPVRHEQLSCVVHPQSIVHCLVSFTDGTTLAQMACPDMRTPIAYALGWPNRLKAPTKRLDLTDLSGLTFELADENRFPALAVARAALEKGGAAPCILNAANEVAVAAFLDRKIGFTDIADLVGWTLDRCEALGLTGRVCSLKDVLDVDREARMLSGSRLDGGP